MAPPTSNNNITNIVTNTLIMFFLFTVDVLGIVAQDGECDGADPNLARETLQAVDLVGGTTQQA